MSGPTEAEILAASERPAPTPLELARLHEAELKQCYRQCQTLLVLIRQIMVGRKVKVASWDYPIEVSEVKTLNGVPCLFGRRKNRKTSELLDERGLAHVEIVP